MALDYREIDTREDLDALLAEGKDGVFFSSRKVHFDEACAYRTGFGTIVKMDVSLTQSLIAGLTGQDRRCLGLDNLQLSDEDARTIAGKLTNLSILDLSDNSIGDAGARAIAEKLTNLSTLYLYNNKIGEAGAYAIAEKLTNLSTLDLTHNNIGEAGGRALLDGFAGRGIGRLDLRYNPLTDALLTPEAFATTDAQAILAAWAAHKAAAEGKRLVALDEAKLLVVGDEAVGKTSLIKFLIHNEPRDPDEKETPGIGHHKIGTEGWTPEGGNIRLNVWDFGGQEIMHGTHRFFLTRRSLYLLVLDNRKKDDPPIAKWLRMIASVAGDDAPVIIVINKHDDDIRPLSFDEDGLSRDFPQVAGVVRTCCNNDIRSQESITALRAEIAKVLAGDRLPHLRSPLPAEWMAVKQAVGEKAEQASILDHDEYRALCTDPAVTGEHPVSDANSQRALLRLLHELGTVVAYGLERDAPAALASVRLLDPNWLTGAIYTVLNRGELKDRKGVFDRTDLCAWLPGEEYPVERHEFILAMMRDPKLELAFPLPGEGERYLAPEGLPKDSPDYSNLLDGALRFRWRYGHLPRGLIPRLIVRMHEYLGPSPTAWLTGARFYIGGADVFVDGDPDARTVDIAVLGAERREALFTLRETMEKLHDVFEDIGAEARVPMPDDPDVEEDYAYLRELEKEEGPDYRHRPSKAKRAYSVRELLDHVDRDGVVAPTQRQVPQRQVPWQTLVPIGAALLGGALGYWELGFSVLWSVLVAAVAAGATFLFDRRLMFRRLFGFWIFGSMGVIALAASGWRLLYRADWGEIGYGGASNMATIAWLVMALSLGYMAFKEWEQER